MAEEGGKGSGELTRDGTVDLRGRPFVRSKGGGWRACSFIVGKRSTTHVHHSLDNGQENFAASQCIDVVRTSSKELSYPSISPRRFKLFLYQFLVKLKLDDSRYCKMLCESARLLILVSLLIAKCLFHNTCF